MSEFKLEVGEYYYDTEGKIFGPITTGGGDEENPYYDGEWYRQANGVAGGIEDEQVPLYKKIYRSEPVHPGYDDYLEECNMSKAEKYCGCTSDSLCEVITSNSLITLKQQYVQFVKKTLDDLQELVRQKNEDYSYGDDPFANFNKSEDIGIQPLAGLYLRMQDKQQRITAFLKRGTMEVPGEGVEDAFMDTIGYSLLALGMIHFAKEENNETGV